MKVSASIEVRTNIRRPSRFRPFQLLTGMWQDGDEARRLIESGAEMRL